MTSTQETTAVARPAVANPASASVKPKPAPVPKAPAHAWKGVVAAALVVGVGAWGWHMLKPAAGPQGLGSGNGRIDATQIDIATQAAGRVIEVLVHEGDSVKVGQVLARMKVDTLEAQRDQAAARVEQASADINTAKVMVGLRERDLAATAARTLVQLADLKMARQHLARSENLAKDGAASAQQRDDDRDRVVSLEAAVAASVAQEAVAQQAVVAAKAMVLSNLAARKAAEASLAQVEASLDDSILVAPTAARVQSRLAEPGEVLGNGGKVLNMIDLTDVYMTFFVPEEVAGRIALGAEARIAVDAFPNEAIPAKISFVDSTAQFTPKTVETANERQKLMFRVKAKVDADWMQQHLPQVKTGVPGVAWVKLDPNAAWPSNLQVKAANAKKE